MSAVELRYGYPFGRPVPDRMPMLFIDGVRTYGMYAIESEGNPLTYTLWMGHEKIMITDLQPECVTYEDGATGYIWRNVEVRRIDRGEAV